MYIETGKEESSEINTLNRHKIVHGLIYNFGSQTDYLRLITLLNSLSVISILAGDPGHSLFPPITPESKALDIYFQSINKLIPPMLKILTTSDNPETLTFPG